MILELSRSGLKAELAAIHRYLDSLKTIQKGEMQCS